VCLAAGVLPVVRRGSSVAELIAEKAKPIEAIKLQVVGRAEAPIGSDQQNCRSNICEMGVLVADAMLDRVKGQGVRGD
jgi:5'-nucleotidase